ncbi:aldo/keto reductase [Micromonospora sp. DT201]|uniref:aldo/keto reductase n=1 Tax=Micromonospora sp. DT201 TaxID=3393442 RepID=UPI003CF438FD
MINARARRPSAAPIASSSTAKSAIPPPSSAGESEKILGRLIERAGVRERLVLTSKATNTVDPTDPNASGNGRKHIMRAVEASLGRLGTDYIDLYLLHTWDRITPVEEVVHTLDDLVRSGKIWRAWPPTWAAAWPRWRSTGSSPSPPSAR